MIAIKHKSRSHSSFEPVVQTTAWPHSISGQMLNSHSIVSSSRTARPCSPWGGRWIGHWRTTRSTVCSSAPHSQAAEEVDPICTSRSGNVRHRCGGGSAGPMLFLKGSFGGVPVSGMKMRSLVGLSAHCAARMLLLSDEMMRCCAAGTNGCLDLRRSAFALDGPVSTGWSRCPGSMARCAIETVWLHCYKAQQVGCLRGLEGCPLV